jgi:hypothetical protein
MPWYCWCLAGAAAFVAVVFAINRPVPEDYERGDGPKETE